MYWVVFSIFALVTIFHVLRWFFTVALPEILRVIGMLWDWLVEVIAGLYSGSVSSWKALKDWFAARSSKVSEAGHGADQSLLDSSAASDINKEANISQTPKPMWPFGSDKEKPIAPTGPNITPVALRMPSRVVAPSSISFNSLAELNQTKEELKKAQETLSRMVEDGITRESELRSSEQHVYTLREALDAADAELAHLRPFAAVKADARRTTYTVSPELHKKWQSIMRDTNRIQVVELLGQPSEILTITSSGVSSPLQLVRKSAPAPRVEFVQYVTFLADVDARIRSMIHGAGCTAWVYADDTLGPGVIIFTSESVGGQISLVFPPEC